MYWRRELLIAVCVAGCSDPRAPDVQVGTSCTDCALDVAETITLGRDLATHNPTTASRIVRDASGRYYVAPNTEPSTIAVFDSTGIFLGSIGRKGSGPGEFTNLFSVHAFRGDSIIGWSLGGPYSILSFDGTFVRGGNSLGYMFDMATLSNGTLAVAASTRVRDGASLLHLAGEDGKPIRSVIGADTAKPYVIDHYVAPARSSFWVASGTRYRFDEYDNGGNHVQSFEIPFPEMPSVPTGGSPRILDIEVDTAGETLWVLIVKYNPSPDSSKLQPRETTARGEQIATIPDVQSMTELFDFEVHVIDLRAKTLLGKAGFEAARSFIGPGQLYTYEEDSDGLVALTLWRLMPRRRQ